MIPSLKQSFILFLSINVFVDYSNMNLKELNPPSIIKPNNQKNHGRNKNRHNWDNNKNCAHPTQLHQQQNIKKWQNK